MQRRVAPSIPCGQQKMLALLTPPRWHLRFYHMWQHAHEQGTLKDCSNVMTLPPALQLTTLSFSHEDTTRGVHCSSENVKETCLLWSHETIS